LKFVDYHIAKDKISLGLILVHFSDFLLPKLRQQLIGFHRII